VSKQVALNKHQINSHDSNSMLSGFCFYFFGKIFETKKNHKYDISDAKVPTNDSDKIERLECELDVLEIRMAPYSHGSNGVTGAK